MPPVLEDLDLTVQPGELVSLLGPSGCGKTTTLRLIAGFERPDAGRIVLEGRELASENRFVPPERRGVGMVFQDYALFPHLSVLGNVMFGLSALRGAARREQARRALALVGLTVFERRWPHELSGGQQQRVAIARALARAPQLILLDEPFSNLDAALRRHTRAEVRAILRRAGASALLVTHDQEEALAFSDRVVVMRAGRIEQSGPPEQVYQAPRTAFVASFLGHSNLLPGSAHGLTARTALGELPLHEPAYGPVLLSVRPEHLRLEAPDPTRASAEVIAREYLGHDASYLLRLEGGLELRVREAGSRPRPEGSRVGLRLEGTARVVRSS
nr:ABC transporter ATP-binding protein [Deinobacterium chartae]